MSRSLLVASLVFGMLAVSQVGCGPKKPDTPPAANGGDGGHGHEHPPHGPNGGHLAEFADGGEFQAEWLYEDDGTVTVHVLDAAAEKPLEGAEIGGVKIRVQLGDQTLPEFELTAQESVPTVYEIKDASLVVHLTGEGEGVVNTLLVTVDGQEHPGILKHHAH